MRLRHAQPPPLFFYFLFFFLERQDRTRCQHTLIYFSLHNVINFNISIIIFSFCVSDAFVHPKWQSDDPMGEGFWNPCIDC